MTRNILLLVVIALLLWSAGILCDIRQALYDTGARGGEGDTRQEKGKQPQKPGRLTPNPQLPQWEL